MAHFFSFLQVARPAVVLAPLPTISSMTPLRSISSSSSSAAFSRRNLSQLKTVHIPPLSSYNATTIRCMNSIGYLQVTDEPPRKPERDCANTPYIPVYVMLPLDVINEDCELKDPNWLKRQLKRLKDANVDGIVVDCWWGITERHNPQEYKWDGYKRLFQIVREVALKLQVVMSFHECKVDDDVHIPLPLWIAEIGKSNPDIFFTNQEGRRNTGCLSWGIDKERVLEGRTAAEVYSDYMRSFRTEFSEFFRDGIISEIQVGLGPCGELRYPSHPKYHDREVPGIGEFQCYDKYLMKSLRKAAEATQRSLGKILVSSYSLKPDGIGSCDGGNCSNFYSKFFLGWYSQVLVDHADLVLYLAKLAFDGTRIAAKISGAHWWYQTGNRVAELASGFYNPYNRKGYASIASLLKNHGAVLNFTCVESRTLNQESLADPEGTVWQVLNDAWYSGIAVASENALTCHERDVYNKILENAKPGNESYGRHLSVFTYRGLSRNLMGRNFPEFKRFVKRMHGEAVDDLQE